MLFSSKKKTKVKIDPLNMPVHVAIIPDGNRRWAKRRGLGTIFGHREGAKRIKEVILRSSELKIPFVSFYVFSTENWSRSKEEVSELMRLILEFLKKADHELQGSNIKINIIGDIKVLPEEIKQEVIRIEDATKNYKGTNLNLYLNYGSRQEILHAVKYINEKNIQIDDMASFRSYLYKPEIPDPDLVIRTSGEFRISNFLLWQNAYAELYFSDKLWPNFTVSEYEKALVDYQKRTRRYGGI